MRRAARRPVVQAQYEPGMLIASGLSDGTLSALGQRGYVIVERHAQGQGRILLKLRVPPGSSLEAARQELRAAEPRALVDLNHYYRPDSLECSGRRCLMRQISGWPIGEGPAACRPTAPIGLIDTRINVKHPSLAASRITLLSLFDADIEPSGAHHGTAVAALLVGQGAVPGLVQGSELVAIDAFRKGDVATGFDLARAIEMLVARGVPVINMSLSGPDNAILAAIVAEAVERNVLLVAAAGNDGPRAKPVYPAAYPGVIAVTAVDSGKNIYRRAARGAHVDIAAPGVNVWTAASVKGQRPRSGTSFAAPFVTAAAALILSENPGFGRREVEIVLQNEANDLGDLGRDDVFGWGLLDVRRVCAG
ncbi:MAG: S8 family serine peptidase [Rhizobium sp.]|nr:S8 family serine peptidase [Rhizobium sp.]